MTASTIAIVVGVLAMVSSDPAQAGAGSAKAEHLLTEYLADPLGIDTARPGFSWRMAESGRGARQTAYQVQVASTEALLGSGKPDLWYSGEVISSDCVDVVYGGKPLASRAPCFWRVRIWDETGAPSEFSKPARFETALLDPSDWHAAWIAAFEGGTGNGYHSEFADSVVPPRAPMLRREFTLDRPVARARAYVTGLGYYELRINGAKVGEKVLDPANATFDRRVYYSVYDVTGMLKTGANCVGAMLGHGWWPRAPQFLLQLEITYQDGASTSVTSDETWRWTGSPIMENSLYHGETCDAREEQPGWDSPGFDDSKWDAVALVDTPGGRLSAQMIQPITVTETLAPKSLTSPKEGVYVFDFGQNFSGWCALSVSGPAGTKITLRHAELIYPDGTVNQENLRSARATDTYILRGGGSETYEPRFTYHGFRYVQLDGFPGTPTLESIRGRVVHTAFEPRGSFTCSNPLLNKVQSCCIWGEQTNFHSIPTDCPQRDERMGWMGDAHMSARAMLYNFDMPPAYAKFLQDIQDAQGEDGSVPDTVPSSFFGSGQGDPMWSAAYPLILWGAYLHTGDKRLLARHYEGIKRYVDSLEREASDLILERNSYGDWISVVPTPKELISTASFHLVSGVAAQIATALGKRAEAKRYRDLCDRIAAAFNAKFLDPKTNQYGDASQLSNAFPLYLGIVPADRRSAVLANLVNDIVVNHKSHLSTGFIGTPYLMDVLLDEGRADLGYTIAAQKTYPGWGYMIANGATTIWELWRLETGPGMNSHNHPALGFVSEWFYKALAGIEPDADAPGWEHFTVKPRVVGDLKWAEATVETVRGKAASSWKRTPTGVVLDVTVPANSRATVYVPKLGAPECRVTESGRPVWDRGRFATAVDGVTSAADALDWVAFEVGSGSYRFEASARR